MKSATSAARSVRVLGRVLMVGALASLLVGIAPSRVEASSSEINNCLDGGWIYDTEHYNLHRQVTECTAGYQGIAPEIVRALTHLMLTGPGQRLADLFTGGPWDAFMNGQDMQGGETEAPQTIAEYSLQWAEQAGPGMPAGYTPHESTGQWLQRQIQPLRDHHVNGWFNTSWASPRDTHRQTRYDADIWTLTVGADMPMLNDDLIFGVFGSYTNSDVDTTFNNGDVESKLGTIGPYFAYTLNEYVGFDTTVAGVFGEHENIIGPPGGGMGSTPGARGDQDVKGFFISMNANANYWIGNWGVQGRLGFLHSDMETDSYTLSSGGARLRIRGINTELTQFSLATQVNYFMDGGLPKLEQVKAMPHFRITFNYDIDHDNIQQPCGGPRGACTVPQHPNDDDEIVLNWGVTLFGDSAFSGSLEMGRTLARSRFEAWSASGTLNYAF